MDNTPRAATRRPGDASHHLSVALQNVRVLRASLSDTQALLDASRTEEKRLRTAHDALAEQCADLRAKVIDLEASLGRRSREVSQLRAALEDTSRVSSERATIRTLQDELSGMRTHIARFTANEQHHAQATEALRLQLSAAEARGTEMAMRIAAMSADARARDTQLAARNAEFAALQDLYAKQQRSRALVEQTLAATKAEMATESPSLLADAQEFLRELPRIATSDCRRVTFEDDVRRAALDEQLRKVSLDSEARRLNGSNPPRTGNVQTDASSAAAQESIRQGTVDARSQKQPVVSSTAVAQPNKSALPVRPVPNLQAIKASQRSPSKGQHVGDDPRDPFNVPPPPGMQSNADARRTERIPTSAIAPRSEADVLADTDSIRTRLEEIKQSNMELLGIISAHTRTTI